MGKLFDSIKRRNGSSPVNAEPPQRLQVVPVEAPAPEEAHTSESLGTMPFYEVPAGDGLAPTTVPIARPHPITASRQPNPSVKANATPAPAQPQLHFTAADPIQRSGAGEIDDRVVVVHHPDTPAAQEFRELAGHLARLATARQVHSLTLLPLEDRQPLAVTAANLGCAWAEFSHHPILLIDAARSKPGVDLATVLGLDHAPGWEELMTGAALAGTIQQTGRAWLDLIGAGRRLAWSNTQAWAKRASGVLQSLRKHYRNVLLLAPAYPQSPLGLVLAETTDSTCILVPAEQANHPQKEPLLRALAQQGGQVLGTLVLDQS